MTTMIKSRDVPKHIESAIYDRLTDHSKPPCSMDELVDIAMLLLDEVDAFEKPDPQTQTQTHWRVKILDKEESRKGIKQWLAAEQG